MPLGLPLRTRNTIVEGTADDSGAAGVGFAGRCFPTREPTGFSIFNKAELYSRYQSSRTSPNCTRSANSAVSASGTPEGVALVSATIATSADGRMTKFVPSRVRMRRSG